MWSIAEEARAKGAWMCTGLQEQIPGMPCSVNDSSPSLPIFSPRPAVEPSSERPLSAHRVSTHRGQLVRPFHSSAAGAPPSTSPFILPAAAAPSIAPRAQPLLTKRHWAPQHTPPPATSESPDCFLFAPPLPALHPALARKEHGPLHKTTLFLPSPICCASLQPVARLCFCLL